ncbi:MAG TPA: hypothetical protein VI197_20850 [Polyangiaceae bacterium]
MTKEELIAEIAKHHEVAPTDAPDTFLNHDESFKNFHGFFRVVADDVVLTTSVMNAASSQAWTTALRILDFAQAQQDRIIGRATTKLAGLDSDLPRFDHLIAMGPELSTSPPLRDARFLTRVTVTCGAIDACEFMGDEGVVELRARVRNVSVSDTQRKIEPAVNARHRFDDGRKSKQKFLAVTRQVELAADFRKLVEVGGVVELENYERVGCVAVGKAGADSIEIRLEGVSRAVPVTRALKFLDVFLRRGVEPARKEL